LETTPELAEEPVVEVTQGRGVAITVGASTVVLTLGWAWARDGSECPASSTSPRDGFATLDVMKGRGLRSS
jgi:hypothetical protein